MRNFFKNLSYCIFFFSIASMLYACPYSSPYKLDSDASLPVDDMLLGKWATMVQNPHGEGQPVKMIISKKNDSEYNIDFTGDLKELSSYNIVKEDTIKGSAYLSTILNREFINIEIKGQTYVSAVIFKDNKLSLLPLADGFTSKYIKSDAELRTAVEVHLHTRLNPRYDDQFCLKDMVRVN